MRRFVEFLKIDLAFLESDGVHSATDIDADDVRNGFVDNRHRRSDRATRARMHVRHDPNLRAARELVIAHSPDLLPSFDLDRLRKRDRRRELAFDRLQFNTSLEIQMCLRIVS